MIGIFSQTMIARALGPSSFGNFNFLTNFYSQVNNFFDAGLSNGFYIKLSQRRKDFGLILFFLTYVGLTSFIVFLFTVFMNLTGLFGSIFPNQEIYFIYLAMLFGIISWYVRIFEKMADAFGITVQSEIIKICQKGLGFVVVATLFITNKLNLTNFFYFQYFISIFLGIALIWKMISKRHLLISKMKLSLFQIRTYLNEFYKYGYPLFVYSLIGLVAGIADKWMLQEFSGSVDQGFFWLSFKISAICLLFTTAISQLIMREFAIAFEKNNIKQMGILFNRYIPLLYSIASFFSCFLALEAKNITFIIGGENFQNAVLTVMIMSFYPIHQTYGHLNSSVYYATGQTKLYRNIGGTFNILRLPITYFLLAPTEMMGLNTGSVGLAASLVFITIINVNTQLFYNTRFLGLQFRHYVIHQIICIGLLVSCALIAKFCVANFLGFQDKVIYSFLSSGLLYSIMVMALIYIQPGVFGLKKNDIQNFANIIKRQFY